LIELAYDLYGDEVDSIRYAVRRVARGRIAKRETRMIRYAEDGGATPPISTQRIADAVRFFLRLHFIFYFTANSAIFAITL
jgi:hypothetical protein